MNLTDEQLVAVTNNDISVCISAGAGSGKTRVLVEKYWHLLELGHEVEEIMAVTFTRKAAQEMIERIRQQIEKSNLDYKRKRALKEALNNAWIGTIDSICSRIIKEYPIEANIDPFFNIAEEVTINQLKYELARDILLEDVNKSNERTLKYIESFGYSRTLSDMQNLLSIIVNKGLSLAHIEALTINNIDQIILKLPHTAQRIKELYDEVVASLSEIGATTKTYKIVEEMADNHDNWLLALHNVVNLTYNSEDYQVLDILFNVGKGNPAKVVKEQLKEIQALVDEVIGVVADYENKEYLYTLFNLTSRLEAKLTIAKINENLLEFADLIDKVIYILQEYPEINSFFQEQFKHIMVDEYQDTNYRQAEFINIISNNFTIPVFAVGDPKQSIYRFRGAQVQLFTETSHRVEENGGLNSNLSMNFRTRENLIELVNNIFFHIMQGSQVAFQPLVAARPRHTDNFAEIHLIHPEFSIEIDNAEAEAYCIVERINEIVNNAELQVYEKIGNQEVARPPRYSDIAILFQKSKNMEICTAILKEYNIPYFIVGSRGFFATEEVNNIILFLKTINNELDEKSLVGILRSQMFGVADETIWYIKQKYNLLNKGLLYLDDYALHINSSDYNALKSAKDLISYLRLNKSRFSLAEIITHIIEATEYNKFLAQQANGEQKLINLQKLLDMTKSKEAEFTNSINDFLVYIDQIKASSQEESQAILDSEASNTVKLMTIHQAKGLEFPIVFLPYIHQEFNISDTYDQLIFADNLGLFLKTEPKSYWRKFAEQEELKLILEEYMRIFYVAQTRACDYLIMSGCYNIKEDKDGVLIPDVTKNSWLKWLFDYFGVKEIPLDKYFTTANINTFLYTGNDIELIMQEQLRIMEKHDLTAILKEYAFNFTGDYGNYELLSATRLLDYEFCPYYAFLKYNQGLSLALTADNLELENLDNIDAVDRGLIIHALIENMPSLTAAQTALDEWTKNNNISTAEKNLMLEMLENYYENEYIQELIAESKLLKEVPFMARLDDNKFIYGFIDQLWIGEDDYHIIDLKTGNINEKYKTQLNIYQIALEKILKQKLKSKAILYLRSGKIELVDDKIIDFNIKPDPEPKSSYPCSRCNYSFICFPKLEKEA